MDFRLLVDSDVIDFIDSLPTGGRRLVIEHFRKIQRYPFNSVDFESPEPDGTSLKVSIMRRYHIFYWADVADRHVKILRIEENE